MTSRRPPLRSRRLVSRSSWDFLGYTREKDLVLADRGDHSRVPTVTNDVDNVVADVVALEVLEPGRRLFYVDSIGRIDEILVERGAFAGFRAGPGIVRIALPVFLPVLPVRECRGLIR